MWLEIHIFDKSDFVLICKAIAVQTMAHDKKLYTLVCIDCHQPVVSLHQGFMQEKLLPVTHVMVDTWMLTVKLVYKVSDVS